MSYDRKFLQTHSHSYSDNEAPLIVGRGLRIILCDKPPPCRCTNLGNELSCVIDTGSVVQWPLLLAHNNEAFLLILAQLDFLILTLGGSA